MGLSSNLYANRVTLLGHVSSGMGERALTKKFASFFEKPHIVDICEVMGGAYSPLARLNYDLADGGYTVMEDLKELELPKSELMIVLSWCFSLAAVFATGVHKKQPTVAKLYAHHIDEKIVTKLYEPADLLITESLLANERAEVYGIDRGKVLYLPHCYPEEWEGMEKSRRYAQDLAARLGKSLESGATIIGTISRFEYGKNCEFAVEAVRRLAEEGENVVLVLKGDFPEESSFPEYRTRFLEMLRAYETAPWLLWDREVTPLIEMCEVYRSFDLLLHPSGAEGGSHVVVEALGMGLPAVVLNGSTNPYLFKGLATFVETTKERRGVNLPFFIPEMEDLLRKLRAPILPNRRAVRERFHQERTKKRLSLLFERDRERIASLYLEDKELYGI